MRAGTATAAVNSVLPLRPLRKDPFIIFSPCIREVEGDCRASKANGSSVTRRDKLLPPPPPPPLPAVIARPAAPGPPGDMDVRRTSAKPPVCPPLEPHPVRLPRWVRPLPAWEADEPVRRSCAGGVSAWPWTTIWSPNDSTAASRSTSETLAHLAMKVRRDRRYLLWRDMPQVCKGRGSRGNEGEEGQEVFVVMGDGAFPNKGSVGSQFCHECSAVSCPPGVTLITSSKNYAMCSITV